MLAANDVNNRDLETFLSGMETGLRAGAGLAR